MTLMGAHPSREPFWQSIASCQSQALLDAIERGWKPPCTTAELDAVRRDALRAIAVLPDPETMALELETGEPCLAEALRSAYLGQRQPNAGWWRIAEGPNARPLRLLGLVEVGDYGLSVFGNAVRKHLLGQLP